MTITRRDFIKANAAAAAAAAAGITLTKSAPAEAQGAANGGIRWDKAVCRFCGTGCGVLVGVKNNRVVATQGDPDAPVNRGLACIKGYFLTKIMYGRDRLTKPLLRKRGGKYDKSGEFTEVSQLEDLLISSAGESQLIYLGDVARVYHGYAEVPNRIMRFGGQQALGLHGHPGEVAAQSHGGGAGGPVGPARQHAQARPQGLPAQPPRTRGDVELGATRPRKGTDDGVPVLLEVLHQHREEGRAPDGQQGEVRRREILAQQAPVYLVKHEKQNIRSF